MKKQIKQRLACNLRKIRQEVGISQEEVARRAGLHLSAVSHHERGNREPRLSTVAKLAAGLGVEPNALFEGIKWDTKNGRFEIDLKK